jgi:hypothetical protein
MTMLLSLNLDRRLADGEDPHATRALERRAHKLARSRQSLAAGIEGVVHEAEAPRSWTSAAVPVQRKQVRDARGELLRLAAALRNGHEPSVRAVAMASVLLTDGASPVFAPHPRGALRQLAFRAAYTAEAH